MSKTQIFIEKARAKHGSRYDYGRVAYVRSSDKIIITCKIHDDFEQRPNDHLMGHGCAMCGKELTAAKLSQKTKDNFIERSRAVHGDRYDYSRVVYVRDKDKVIISCGKHGDFEQIPSAHLMGSGCYKCGRESVAAKQAQKAKDGFIEKAREKHGDRYSYEHVVYVQSKSKIIIACAKHGNFEQTPNDHLAGTGCAKCAGVHVHSTQEWIQEAVAVHGDRYGYDRVVYARNKDKVIITCKKHGDFEQIPNSHLSGSGCIKCGFEETAAKQSEEFKNSFIERSRAVHGDRYSYEHVVYVRSSDKVIITCKQHGEFEQTPNSHLRGQGCPSCPRRYDQPTNLYLMHNGLGKVKVGYSIDTDKRISELNSSAPFKAELLETWTLPDTPTVRKIEGKVHRKLAKYHAGLSGFAGATEWFDTSPERAKGAILKALSGAEVLGHSEADSLQLALI